MEFLTASLILQQWAILECQASLQETLQFLSLLDTKTIFSLPFLPSCYLPTKIEGTHYRSLFYREVGLRFRWANFWFFSDKALLVVWEVFLDIEDCTGGKKKTQDGTKTVILTSNQAGNISTLLPHLNVCSTYNF